MSAGDRPVRNLAAWGYQSSSTGDRVEVDVWTVNRREGDGLPDPSDFDANVVEVIAAAGDVAKVRYGGIDAIGYRRVSSDEAVSQQAFAGASRSAGARDRTGRGTFAPGGGSGVIGPDLQDVIRHGEREVLPIVRANLREFGREVGREPSRDEDEEPVETRPIADIRNVVRVFTRGTVFRYAVDGGEFVSAGRRGGVA